MGRSLSHHRSLRLRSLRLPSPREASVALSTLALVMAALVSTGCEQKTPLQKAQDLRAKYTAELNTSGFAVTPHLMVEPVAEGEALGDSDDALEPTVNVGEDATIEGSVDEAIDETLEDLEEAVPAEPVGYDVLLDVVLANGNRENLQQLTVDVVQASPDEQEKQRWQVTFDVANLLQGMTVQKAHKLENIEYQEGDLFYSEVRADVPAGERSKYPELAGLEG